MSAFISGYLDSRCRVVNISGRIDLYVDHLLTATVLTILPIIFVVFVVNDEVLIRHILIVVAVLLAAHSRNL